MTVPQYKSVPAFEGVVLEESFVLGIAVEPGIVTFAVEFVLAPDHVEYRVPPPEEQFCFNTGTLVFSRVSDFTWTGQGAPPATDATGESDYGHIDFLAVEGPAYSMGGDWGTMRIVAGRVDVELDLTG